MKKILVIALLLAAFFATNAEATTSGDINYRGVWCTTANKFGNESTGAVLCIKGNNTGYGVGISKSMVMVYSLRTNKPVFVRYQP